MNKLAKPLWFGLAALFLFEAWLWDELSAALHALADRLPFDALKRALARGVERLPAPVVLLVFLIPLAVIEPLKIVALWCLAHHHIFYGIAIFAAAKVFGLGLIAFLFDLTRAKLLSMPWFVRLYDLVLRLRAWAHAVVEPYAQELRASVAALRRRLQGQGRFGRRLGRLWARTRRRSA